MSWPVPSGASASGPVLPVVPLPWAGRDPSRSQVSLPLVRSQYVRRGSKSLIRAASYILAMAVGPVVVRLTKRVVNSIPGVNLVTRPVLALVPSGVVGSALGAAVVYGLEQGDLLAARHVVRDKVRRVRQEIEVIVQDISSEVHANPQLARQLERSQGALEGVARVVVDSVAELERTVLPATEREYRRLEAQARQALQDVSGEGPGYRS